MQSLKLYTWPAVAGLLAALLILDRWVLPKHSAGTMVEAVSYAGAVSRATPAVVNIYTAKLVTPCGIPSRRRYSFLPRPQETAKHNTQINGII